VASASGGQWWDHIASLVSQGITLWLDNGDEVTLV